MTTIADETLWCATCAARAEYLRGRSDGATSMRSACVERLLQLANNGSSEMQIYWLRRAAKELESLSIQEQKS